MVIVGAKGHAADIVSDSFLFAQEKELFFFDDLSKDMPDNIFAKYSLLSSFSELTKVVKDTRFILAVGQPEVRKSMYRRFSEAGYSPYSYVSNLAMLSKHAVLGEALNIMPFSAVFATAELGRGVLVNSYASVHHGAVVKDFSVISPGARVLGRTYIGEGTEVGAQAVVLPDVRVGHGAFIGAGAVVTKNVPPYAVVTGVPGRVSRMLQ